MTENLSATTLRSATGHAGRRWFVGLLIVAALIVGVFAGRWFDKQPPASARTGESSAAHAGAQHEHSHDHAHEGHSHDGDLTSVALSQQARGNIGLKLETIEFKPFERTVTLPGMIVERQGKSRVWVTAPLTGIITRVFPGMGEAVEAGQPLFDLRLTHEELVQAQGEYLQTLEQLDVLKREITRLEGVAAGGAIAGKVVLERQYEEQKLEAIARAQAQALALHGLTTEQVEGIKTSRRLLGELTVFAPAANNESHGDDGHCLLQVEELSVERGKHVTAGDPLCVLSDMCALYVEGKAFEQDLTALNDAVREHWKLRATLEQGEGTPQTIDDLQIFLLGSQVDATSRTLPFYAHLPNEVVRDEKEGNRRFVGWRYKPGQRMEIQVPVASWPERIVLPKAAVVEEGAESYVFVQRGDRFERRPVHVEYRDQNRVLLAEDNETIWPGDVVAVGGAQQLQLALKIKSSGGVDPHAGHSH